MNEIKKCSLAGISFTFENDAYVALSEYIQSLQNAYRNDPDGEEIIADIEARIAELILSAIAADAIVTKPLILNIIKQLGSAEEIDSEQPEHTSEPRQAETTDSNGNPRIPRRLYRDVQHHKLGGVCAGIANYFDIDPTWVRLAAFAPIIIWLLGKCNFLFFSFTTHFTWQLTLFITLGYVVMWFTIPPAATARQKLEMKGERITTDSIRENVQNASTEVRTRTIIADIVNIIGKILLICLKIFAAILLVGLVVGVCVLGMVAIAGFPMLAFNLPTGIALIAFFGVVMLPLLTLIYLVIMLLISMRPKGKALLVIFILWIISITTMTISAIKSPARFENSIENLFESVFEHDEKILYKEFTQEEIDEWRQQMESKQGALEIKADSILSIPDAFQQSIDNTLKEFDENSEAINEAIKQHEHGISLNTHYQRGSDITKKVSYNIGNQFASCHNNGDRMVIFCGKKSDVERCQKNLTFEETRVTFKTKRGDYSIERSGKVYKEGKRINEVAVNSIKDDSKSLYFVVDNVKIKYEEGKDINFDAISQNTLDHIFGAASSIFKLAGGVFKLTENIFNSTSEAFAASGLDTNVFSEIQEELQEAQQELNDLQKLSE